MKNSELTTNLQKNEISAVANLLSEENCPLNEMLNKIDYGWILDAFLICRYS